MPPPHLVHPALHLRQLLSAPGPAAEALLRVAVGFGARCREDWGRSVRSQGAGSELHVTPKSHQQHPKPRLHHQIVPSPPQKKMGKPAPPSPNPTLPGGMPRMRPPGRRGAREGGRRRGGDSGEWRSPFWTVFGERGPPGRRLLTCFTLGSGCVERRARIHEVTDGEQPAAPVTGVENSILQGGGGRRGAGTELSPGGCARPPGTAPPWHRKDPVRDGGNGGHALGSAPPWVCAQLGVLVAPGGLGVLGGCLCTRRQRQELPPLCLQHPTSPAGGTSPCPPPGSGGCAGSCQGTGLDTALPCVAPNPAPLQRGQDPPQPFFFPYCWHYKQTEPHRARGLDCTPCVAPSPAGPQHGATSRALIRGFP